MRFLAIAICTVVLTGCSTQVQYKVGVTPAQRNKDLNTCNMRATQAYPVRIVQHRTPRYYVPSRPVCYNGRCGHSGGYWEGGDVYSVDVNKSERSQAFAQCVSAKGYQSVELPNCTGEARKSAVRSTQSAYPQLNSESCTVTMQDGSIKVHTP